MQSPSVKKVEKMSEGIKSLVGKKITKSFKFMGEDVKIAKLSVLEVMKIQERAKGLTDDSEEGFEILKSVIRAAVEGASELSDDDFAAFPMDELSKLSDEIMKFSGLGKDQGK